MNNYHEGKLVYPEYPHIDNRNYIVDIAEIVKQKHKIPMQYEELNIGGNSDVLHYLCRKLDRYLLHIVEEIAEFKEEVDKLKLDKKQTYVKMTEEKHSDALMELIDVAAYVSSVISILFIDYYGLEAVKEGEYYHDINGTFPLIDAYEIFNKHDKQPIIDVINGSLIKIEKILMLDVRRQFPERKWHKDVNRTLSITELRILYHSCIEGTCKALKEIVSMFLYLTEENYELFNKLFLEKNEVVYNLKG